MKVAVNTRLLLAHRMEGVARYIYETSKEMVLAHPDVEFHFLFDRPFDQRFVFAKNVIPHIIAPQSRHPILWYLWFEHALPQFFKKNRIDVFYSGDMYLSLKIKVPTLYVSHDLNYIHYPDGLRWSHLKYYQRYMPRFHMQADHIIAVSEATKKDIVKQYAISDKNISVAGNALPQSISKISTSAISKVREKVSQGNPYFVYVGSLHPRKNIDSLIKAFNIFKESDMSDCKLVLYGRNAWKTSSLFSLYNASKFKNDIVFLNDGDCSVSEVLSAAKALCYVSLFEGFGIPILEAFACEIPVITSNVSSMPEVAGDAAILVNPKLPQSIADAMSEIMDTETNLSEMVSKGKARLTFYSWKNSAKIIFNKLKTIQ